METMGSAGVKPGRPEAGRPAAGRRLFAGVAVAASAGLRRFMADAQRALRTESIRWTRPEKLHLTVEFFGCLEEKRIPGIAAALERAAAQSEPFRMKLNGWGLFGGARNPRILWLGVESPGLTALHETTATALRAAGWTPVSRPFAPHLTLGRMDRLRDPQAFRARLARANQTPADEQDVRELILYESIHGQYVPLQRWPLAGGSPMRS